MTNFNEAEMNLVLPQLNILAFVDSPWEFLCIVKSGWEGEEEKGVGKIDGR